MASSSSSLLRQSGMISVARCSRTSGTRGGGSNSVLARMKSAGTKGLSRGWGSYDNVFTQACLGTASRHSILAVRFRGPSMKTISCAALAVLALVSPSFAASDGFVRQTVQVAPNVHLIYRPVAINAPYEGNSIVIEQSDGLVVVDAGGSPPSGEYIVAEIKKFSNKPVKDLIYTHYHGDHNLGAGAFLKAWPNLTIISTAATKANMSGKP